MKRVHLLKHEGKSIIYMDFTALKDISIIEEIINEARIYIRKQPSKSVLTLSDIEGMHFNADIKSVFFDFVKGNKEYVAYGAVVGLSGLQRIVYNGIMKLAGRDVRSFETMELAKMWLVSKEV